MVDNLKTGSCVSQIDKLSFGWTFPRPGVSVIEQINLSVRGQGQLHLMMVRITMLMIKRAPPHQQVLLPLLTAAPPRRHSRSPHPSINSCHEEKPLTLITSSSSNAVGGLGSEGGDSAPAVANTSSLEMC